MLTLSEEDITAEYVVSSIAYNFNKLYEDVKNLLNKLQWSLKRVIKDLSRSPDLWKKESLRLISIKIDKVSAPYLARRSLGFSGSEPLE